MVFIINTVLCKGKFLTKQVYLT